MRIATLALAAPLAVAGWVGASILTASPAEAQRQRAEYYRGDRVYTQRAQPRARVMVRARSYLDAGTEVLPGERKYTDYAVPYGYSAVGTVLGPTFGWDRRPFNDPWDVPQRYGW